MLGGNVSGWKKTGFVEGAEYAEFAIAVRGRLTAERSRITTYLCTCFLLIGRRCVTERYCSNSAAHVRAGNLHRQLSPTIF